MNTPADLLKQLRIERDDVPEPNRTGWFWLVITLLVIALLGLGIWRLSSKNKQTLSVQTALVSATNTVSATVLDASGYVVARRMATVAAKVTGRLSEVLIEEGMQVEKDQVLARLESTDADAQYALARAQLLAAQSRLSEVQAQLIQAQTQAQRLAELVDQQLVSRAQYDQAIAARDTFQAQLMSLQRSVDVSQQSLHIAEIGVDNTIVRAPFAGVVVTKDAQPGEIISPLSAGGGFTRTGICTIVDMDSLEVEVDVGESYIGRVQGKMPVEATLNAYPDWKIPAEVIAIIPTADRGKATVRVRIALLVKDPRIVPDMGVKVGFLDNTQAEDQTNTPHVYIPANALVQRDQHDLVFVLTDEGKASARAVKAGRLLGNQREIHAGLEIGQTVIVDPPLNLTDGQRVNQAQP